MKAELVVCEREDLWHYLSNTPKPIVIYGMGNGADKIVATLEQYGREPDDYFASDGFVRGHMFRGKRVMSFGEICKKYDSFIILLSFASSLTSVLERIFELDNKYELYAPDVPVYGEGLFTREYYEEHYDELNAAYKLLYDEDSREEYREVIEYKLSGKINYLRNSHFDIEKYINSCYNKSVYIDGGAYNGDSVNSICRLCPGIKSVYAFEPDAKSFARLTSGISQLSASAALYQGALYSKSGVSYISAKANRNTSLKENISSVIHSDGARLMPVHLYTVDGILGGERADIIKLDVEGTEREAMLGAQHTIEKYSPDMQISLYHRTEDLYSLILLAGQYLGNKKFYVGKSIYVPAWDFNLYITE